MTPMHWTTLVDVPALAARLGDARLRLLDARAVLADPQAGAAAFAASHLPGAVHLPTAQIAARVASSMPGAGASSITF